MGEVPGRRRCRRHRSSPRQCRAIAERSLSRFHAEIVRHSNGTYTITDLGSKNGMRVRFHPATSAPLSEGDLIEFGHVRFRFALVPVDEHILEDTQTLEAHRLWPERERRANPRVAVHARALLYDADTGCVDAEVTDVSDGGMFIKTENPPTMHTPVTVVVELEKGHWHTLHGEVARQTAKGAGIRLNNADASKVQKLIRLKRSTGEPIATSDRQAGLEHSAQILAFKKSG